MSIYDKASLVLIPSGTKTSKVYSQKPVNGDGDFTFSRSTAATRVNADGNIEKETQNLLLQSNSFNTTWTTTNTSLTSGQSGYDGSSDAWLLSKSDVAGLLQQTISSSSVSTFSVYLKAGTLNWGWIILRDSVGGNDASIYLDLSGSGALGTSAGGAFVDANIVSIGSGWFRCDVTNSGGYDMVRIAPADGDGDLTGTSGNIYIQDAQLEQGLVARDYIETTTAAVEGGITDNVPRLDYTDSSCPALLLEPQRRNLVRHSEYIGGLEVGHTPTISIESVTNPEGYSFAYKVVAVSTSSRVQDNIGTQGNNMVFSGFFKGTGTATRLRFRNNQGAQVQYNIDSSGNFSLQFEDAANDNYGIEDYGNGWHRIYFETTTASGGTDNYIQVYPDSENGTGSVYVWGLQVEDNGAGGGASYPTSYIPTYGTSVTRNADAASKTGISSLIGQTEGTVFIDFKFNSDGAILGINRSFQNMIQVGLTSSNLLRCLIYNSGTSTTLNSTSALVEGTNYKVAITYKSGASKIFINGSLDVTNTNALSFNAPLELLEINANYFFSSSILEKKQILTFPTALSDADCITLTT
jgi:hypothetical protein